VINRIYASVLNVPILLPSSDTTSLGAAIFAFLAAGAFSSVEQAQQALCPSFASVEPEPQAAAIYQELFEHYRSLYFALGIEDSESIPLGRLLPSLRRVSVLRLPSTRAASSSSQSDDSTPGGRSKSYAT
jgi:L-ribulokinase